jgi:hypothetical protein
MDIPTLVMAYSAALLVALAVTAAFAAPIEEMLFRLLPKDISAPWQKFIKFALFVAAFTGGMPSPPAAFIDRNVAAVPVPGMGMMVVMKSVSGSLMAAAWFLLIFFAATLTALTGANVYASLRRRREEEARELAEREKEREHEKERQDLSERHDEPLKRDEPHKRQESGETRPVRQEKPVQQHRTW